MAAPKDVLILSGAQQGLPLPDAAIAALVGRLKERGLSASNLYVENLDLSRAPDRDHPEMLAGVLGRKLQAARPGVVVVVGLAAMQFITGPGRGIVAPEVPVVTVVVSNPEIPWTGTPPPMLVIPDRVDAAGTLQGALAVFPGTRRVVVVADRGVQPLYAAAVRQALSELPGALEVEFTSELPHEAMLRRMASLPPSTLVLYSPYFEDLAGQKFVPAEVAGEVGRSANAPVFALFEPHLVPGVVGGSVVDLRQVGREAADQAYALVRGERRLGPGITELPLAPAPVFDWLEVERWKGDTDAIPASAVVRNRPLTLWGQYRQEVIATLGVISVLSALVAASLVANRRQRQLTAQLRSSEQSLAGLNAALEAKVAERTAELRRAHLMLAEGERLAGLGVWDYDVEKGQTVWSEGGRQVYGIDPQAAAPDYRRVLRERTHAGDAALIDQMLAGALARQEPFAFEHRIVQPDGTVRYVGTRAVPYRDAEGRLVKYIGTALDITSGKQAEAELRQHRDHLEVLVQARTAELALAKEVAEAASRAKTTFLATMSHELRTPMNAIMGMTTLVRLRATDPKQIEHLGKVDLATRHLMAIINDILDISRIEANKLHLQEEDFELDETLQGVERLLRVEADAKRVGLAFDVAPGLRALPLRGDAQRLGQILVNLVGNAVKFTEAGSVTVGAREAQDDGDQVVLRFEVADTGVGIAAGDLHRLFEAFEQIDGSLTRKHGGTGLGLAISRLLVERMGGVIGVKSQPGVGSTFWFTVRLRKAGAAAPLAPA